MHREIEDLESFLLKQKLETKASPIVLRSQDRFQEDQHAIYKMREKLDRKYDRQSIDYHSQPI